MHEYFSDREQGPKPRTEHEVSLTVWQGIWHQLARRVASGAFGMVFPEQCSDGLGVCGCDAQAFWETADAELPDFQPIRKWQQSPAGYHQAPPLMLIMDLIQFAARNVAAPVSIGYHNFLRHYHFTFDRQAGLSEFVNDINRLFARNGLAYELLPDGIVRRIAPPILHEMITTSFFRSGDQETDRLLESARQRFLHPDLVERRVDLEHLWDAFERIKTLEQGKHKSAQVTSLLDRSSNGPFRDMINDDGNGLTIAGNNFRIRHSETNQINFANQEEMEYLFHKGFAWIYFVLKRTGRVR